MSPRSSRRHSSALAGAAPLLIAVLAPFSATAQTADSSATPQAAAATAGEATVADVVVSAPQSSAEQSSEQRAAAALAQVPGAATLVTSSEIRQNSTANLADILSNQPGVFAQSTSGGDAIRLSIRGSGLTVNPLAVSRGVATYIDGLPILTPTGMPPELVEPLALSSIEIMPGANAFQLGALTLGGGINYIPYTGYNSSPFQARFEAGSFGYSKGQISSGQVIGPFDYYASFSGFTLNGFRQHSQDSNVRFDGNIGYQVTPNLETRFYLDFAHEYMKYPYTLTWAQLQANPTQANATAAKADWYKLLPASVFVGNNTKVRIDEASAVEFGFSYLNFPQSVTFGGPFLKWATGNVISGVTRYIRTDDIAGHQDKSTLAVIASTIAKPTDIMIEGWPNFLPFTSTWNKKGTLIENLKYGGGDIVLLADNGFALRPDLWLTTGIALSDSPRISDYTYPTSQNFSKNYENYAPRVGLRYNINPDIQVFGNVSKSVEAPVDYAISAVLSPGTNLDLKEQTAWTAEAGTRGKAGIFQWNFAYYHSWVENELLTVALPGYTGIQGTFNASQTTHQGIELGFDTLLWQSRVNSIDGIGNPLEITPDPTQQQIVLRQVYTWSDFHYVDDPTFGTNRLPGIPINFYKATLEYRHPSGFTIGANVESVFNSYPVDYANTYYARPYAILGARVGYKAPKAPGDTFQWEAFLEGKNLTNAKYAALVVPVYNAGGQDVSAFYPGDGIAVSAGLSLRY